MKRMLLVLAVLLAAGPVRADWLVTREGARLETKGKWTVKGKLVVFHTADGKLSSLRVSEVDLDASRRATEEAIAAQAQAAAESEKEPERKKSVRVITDKDVKKAAPVEAVPEDEEGAAPAEGGEASEEASPPGPTSGPGLVVASWNQERDPKDDYVVITGTLQNAAGATSADTKLRVVIFDETGTQIATSDAALKKTALPAGGETEFKAEFPGYFSFATIKFEPTGRPLARQPEPQPEG